MSVAAVRSRLAGALASRASREAAVLLLGRGFGAIAAFVGIRALTGVMDPELYGRYALVNAFIALVSGFLIGPVAQAMNRFLHDAAQAGAIRPLLRHGIGVTSALAVAGGVAAVPFVLLCFRGLRGGLAVALLVAATLLFGSLRERQLGCFNTFRWRGRYVVLSTLDAWARVAAVVAGVLLVGGLAGATAGLALSAMLVAFLGLPWLRELARQPGQPGSNGAFDARALYRFAGPMFLVNLLSWTIASSDRYVVGALQGDEVLGRYVAGCQLASAAPSVVVAAFFPILTPILYEHMARHPDKPMPLDRYLLAVTALSALFAGAVAADIDGASRVLLSSRRFDTGDAVIPWVSVGLLLLSMQQVIEHQAYFTKRTTRLVFVHSTAAVTNVALNVSLSPILGITAPALATAVTYLVLLGGTVLAYRPSVGAATWMRAATLVIAAAMLAVLARAIVPADWTAQVRAPLRWTLFCVAYLGVVWLTAGHLLLGRTPEPAPDHVAA